MHELSEEIKVLQLQIRMNRKLIEALSKKDWATGDSVESAFLKIKDEVQTSIVGKSEKFKLMMERYFSEIKKIG